MKRGSILVTALALAACSNFYLDTTSTLRDANKANLKKLSVGMKKPTVMEVMGTEPSKGVFMWIDNPYRTESVTGKDGRRYEVLYYYTDLKQRDDKITDDELTPLIFENGKLIAWGHDALHRLGR
jgi:Protein of unknown function (DUF3192)